MEITCVQMDVLISFYIDGELTKPLKKKVEEHLRECPTCRAKYNILSSFFSQMYDSCNEYLEDEKYSKPKVSQEYKNFRTNLSAYVDNELPPDESVKIKKYTISNKKARKDLEDTYNIRKLMNNSFKKTKSETKSDFSKNVLKQLELDTEYNLAFGPLLKVAAAFVVTVIVLTAIIIVSMSV